LVPQQHPAKKVATKKKVTLLSATALSPPLAAANEVHIIEDGLKPDAAPHQRARKRTHGARAPPPVRLLDKHDVCAIANVTYPTIWAWMRARPPKFPRSRIVGEKSMWLSTDIDAWLAGLKVRPLKGDAPTSPISR
jgi:predicted DNA-binding transcriptional regulator AlpA